MREPCPKPNYIFAPTPSQGIIKNDIQYSYVRPLATIEPTAIKLGLPVNAQVGFSAIWLLMRNVLKPQYHSAVVYITWEHYNIIRFTKLLFKYFHYKPKAKVIWANDDYNTVFVFKINWNKSPATVSFSKTSENMKSLSAKCPD